jgi:hypothetical protein
MNGIGDCFTPTKSPTITQEYVKKVSVVDEFAFYNQGRN